MLLLPVFMPRSLDKSTASWVILSQPLLIYSLDLNEATFHLCILVVATSEDERFVAPYCRSLHIAQQAKIPGLILAGDIKPQGIAPGWTFDVKICGTICCGNSLCIRDQTKVVP